MLCTLSCSVLQWKITHLDGRQVVIKTRPGEIIQAEIKQDGRTLPYILMVKDEGMPSHGNPFVKGNLYIAFHVAFPKTLPQETIAALLTILPDDNMEEAYDPAEAEEHFMDPADLQHFGKGGAVSGAGEYDSDEEGAQPVQCQQS
jgi:DnaJ family protein A protein 2